MEGRNAPVEVAQSNDLAVEMKRSCENDCSCGNSKETNEVSIPICFLVKEQAKSLVAIQELQKRMENVEYIQEDVIDSLVEIRNFLCNDTKSLSGLNLVSVSNSVTRSPNCSEKSPFIKPRRFSCSPPILQATLEVPHSALKVKPYPQKVCDQLQNEYKAQSSATNVNEHSQKIFDLAKTKDSALESDKQDSGLDSDCREQNDAHLSLNKHSLNWPRCESNDELLQLLDEISQRSEILQKQLAVVEENVTVGDLKSEMSTTLYPNHHDAHEHLKSIAGERSKFSFEGTSHKEKRGHQGKLYTRLVMGHDTEVEENVPIIIQSKISGSPEYFERKAVCNNVTKMKKRAASKIDSAMVSSVLKETNVVDLQRQVLIYLVENTVLQTKLSETEQRLTTKTIESEKLENSLKDETRLLMMENRELRISLDEQKLEVNSLKSKVSMLERVLQSITVENRELNWQLGESLRLQNMARHETHNFSSSFTFGNTANNATPGRRSSLPHRFSGQNEMNVNCVKSKRISNSSFLDGAIEESDQHLPPSAIGSFKCQNGPLQSSTPLLPFNKQKDIKFSLTSSSSANSTPDSQSPSNFQTIKKRLKSNNLEKENAISKSHRSEKCLTENDISERYNKGLKLSSENAEGATKFPFNSILEKLKSNADYNLSKRISVTQDKVPDNSTSEQVKLLSCKTKTTASQSQDNISHSHETKSQISNVNSSHENSQDNLHARKGRNIHQRIQDILDRIMAESEETT